MISAALTMMAAISLTACAGTADQGSVQTPDTAAQTGDATEQSSGTTEEVSEGTV